MLFRWISECQVQYVTCLEDPLSQVRHIPSENVFRRVDKPGNRSKDVSDCGAHLDREDNAGRRATTASASTARKLQRLQRGRGAPKIVARMSNGLLSWRTAGGPLYAETCRLGRPPTHATYQPVMGCS